MIAEIITIGDEILIGQTIDTNSAWLGEHLHLHGIRLNRISTISDSRDEIIHAIDESFSRSDLILMTGGLGPTQDDITKETLAEYFGTSLEMHEETLARIEAIFASNGRPMLEVNRQQAALPVGAEILKNRRGTAMGMWFERDGKVLISTPGVPYEMKGIMRDYGFDKLRAFFRTQPIIYKMIRTQGIGESFLADMISDWETALRNEGIALAYLPSPGIVKLRLSGFAENGNAEYINERIDYYVEEIFRRIPEYAYGIGNQTLGEVVGQLLAAQNQTLALAESCTGGMLAHQITVNPDASDYFLGSVVTYTNETKMALLGVSKTTLEEAGVVSEKTVMEMARGARKRFNATYAIATTGIAGPGGETDENPVGTIWIGISGPKKTVAKKINLGKNRSRNITVSALTALNWIRIKILAQDLE